jgi:hypothetical protein
MGEERSFGRRRLFWRAGLLYNSLALTLNPWRPSTFVPARSPLSRGRRPSQRHTSIPPTRGALCTQEPLATAISNITVVVTGVVYVVRWGVENVSRPF